jgi:UDP:flavonoid glycosyltransferase YjiC (YdhE family)
MSARRYLVALVDGGGTVPPELGAVRRLVERGHTVTVLAEHSTAEEVAATGAALRPWVRAPNRPDRLPEHDPSRDWEASNPVRLVERLIQTQFVGPAAGYAADVDMALGEARPEAMVCSLFALGAMVAAESAGVPFAVLLPNIYLLPAPGMPPFGLGLRPAKTPLGRLRDLAVGGFTRRLWDRSGLPRLNALRAERCLAPLDHLWDQVHRARRQLVMTSRDFDFPASLPDGVRYVGPVLDDPAWAGRPWRPPAGDDPLVLVAMSSVFQDQLGCLRRIAEAMGTLPVRAVVTTGPALDPAALHPPDNVEVLAAAPHRQVLEHAALVVTHGGHGTVMKALAAGVPMVVLHHGRDQADNAARLTARGAGVAVTRTATPDTIARAASRVLADPSYPAAAARLGQAVRRDASSGALLRELEALPAAEPAP